MKKYVQLLRIKHWIKNGLIFVPAFFGGLLAEGEMLFRLSVAFVCFSFAASFIYIINDIRDCEQDRKHELKKKRPIASGTISKSRAIGMAGICLTAAVGGTIGLEQGWVNYATGYIVLYVTINLLYSYGMKNVAILDVLLLASGFVIRVLFGAAVSQVQCSVWLILCIMVISLYLGLGKRRNELMKIQGMETRKVLEKYTIHYLDTMMKMCITLGIVFYSLWSVDIGGGIQGNWLIWTVPLVMTIVMKYELELEKNSYGDPVEVIYGDKILILLSVAYVAVMCFYKYV